MRNAKVWFFGCILTIIAVSSISVLLPKLTSADAYTVPTFVRHITGTFPGGGALAYFNPSGIAFDSLGKMYVTDTGRHAVDVFGTDGQLLTTFGTSDLASASSIAISTSTGKIFVTDDISGLVIIFSSAYEKLGQISQESFTPNGLGVANGVLYVSNGTNISEFNENGAFIKNIGSEEVGNYKALAVDGQGNVYVSKLQDEAENFYILEKFDSASGVFSTIMDSSYAIWPQGIAVYNNKLYFSDGDMNQMIRSDLDGSNLENPFFGSEGDDLGTFRTIGPVAISSEGNIFVGDHGNRIQKFSSAGAFLGYWGSDGIGDGQLKSAYGLSMDAPRQFTCGRYG